MKAAGYTQKRFAEIMGVHRTAIARQYKAENVEPAWVYALAGLIASKSANDVVALIAPLVESRIIVVKHATPVIS